MTKIYINGRFLTQNITGVQRYAIEMIKALDDYINNLPTGKYKFIILAPKIIKQDLNLKNIDIKQVGNLNGHLWEQLNLPFYSKDGFLLNLCNCAPLMKKNQAVTIHDAAVSAVPKAYSFAFRTWYKCMYYLLGYRLNTIFTVSRFSIEELHRYFHINLSKMYVTYNGIEHILEIKPDENVCDKYKIEKNNYILAVSSLNPSKNFKLILETAKLMPNYNFVIAGGTNKSVFKSKGLDIPENVKFIGYVTDKELVALYKYAYCFVYPSLYEGFGIPPLEAILFGCPVIVSDIPVFKEVYGSDMVYCDNRPEDLSDKISKINVLMQKEDINNIKSKFLNRYSWKESSKLMIEKIFSILSDK